MPLSFSASRKWRQTLKRPDFECEQVEAPLLQTLSLDLGIPAVSLVSVRKLALENPTKSMASGLGAHDFRGAVPS